MHHHMRYGEDCELRLHNDHPWMDGPDEWFLLINLVVLPLVKSEDGHLTMKKEQWNEIPPPSEPIKVGLMHRHITEDFTIEYLYASGDIVVNPNPLL